MDVVFLSRIQFGFTAGFHFIFPSLTLGLTLVIFILESMYVKRNEEIYKNVSDFLIRILALVFVVGAATGISLEFAFGTNWSNYARMVGDIFGAPLAAEGVFAFFMESIFLGVLVFGRNKVSKKMYRLSAFLVLFGAHLSGLWILIANSFMQTPAGYEIIGGRAVLTNFFEAAINHSTLVRYTHVIVASWVAGSLLVAGIAAWYLLKKRHIEHAKILLKVATVVFIISGILQLFTGHQHAVQVAKTQPAKLAAFEGMWETQTNAPLSMFGIPDAEKETTHLAIGIPSLLSIMVYYDSNAKIQGLKDFPKDERPPVLIVFTVYHIMIVLGTIFVAMAFLSAYLLFKNKLWDSKWFLKLMLFSIPLPHIAIQTGWMAAEIGRQPWAVYQVLRTADAASVVVPAWQVLFTLIMFVIIYTLTFVIFMKLILKTIRKGPEQIKQYGY